MRRSELSDRGATGPVRGGRRLFARICWYVVTITVGVMFIVPFAWQLSTALKPHREALKIPIHWIPHEPTLDNFAEITHSSKLFLYMLNSGRVTLLNLAGDIVVGSFVGYGFAKRRFPGREQLFLLVLASMMIPFQVSTVPLYMLYQRLDWLNTFKPLWVPAFFAADALFVFLFRQFFRNIPDELDQAAEIDGCNPVQTYWRVALPLSGPVVATVAIFSFMNTWNNLWQPLIYINSERFYTIALGLQQFVGEYSIRYGPLMAAATIALIPPVAVFLLFQRYFVAGVALSGMKG